MDPGTSLLIAPEAKSADACQLVTPPSANAESVLFLFPAAEGKELYIRRLDRHLGDTLSVSLLLPDSHDPRPVSKYPQLSVSQAVASLRSAQSFGPYLLGAFGSSAVTAFDAATLLQQQGQKVRLVLFDAPLPGNRFGSQHNTLYRLPLMCRLTGWIQPTSQGSCRLARFEILHFVPEKQGRPASRLGWERRTTANTTLVYLPGTHESLFAEANLARLVRMLKQWLDDAL